MNFIFNWGSVVSSVVLLSINFTFNWGSVVSSVVLLSIFIFTNRRAVKKLHEESMKKWEDLLTELGDYPPHEHMERAGSLSVMGIRFRRKRRGT